MLLATQLLENCALSDSTAVQRVAVVCSTAPFAGEYPTEHGEVSLTYKVASGACFGAHEGEIWRSQRQSALQDQRAVDKKALFKHLKGVPLFYCDGVGNGRAGLDKTNYFSRTSLGSSLKRN